MNEDSLNLAWRWSGYGEKKGLLSYPAMHSLSAMSDGSGEFDANAPSAYFG